MEEDSSVSTLWASCWSKGITSAKFATTAANRHLCGGEKVWPVLAWTITRQTINENDDDDDDDDDDDVSGLTAFVFENKDWLII